MTRIGLAAIGLLLSLNAVGGAEVYPSRSVTMVVPSAAGGPTDTVARMLAERMRMPLGQSVIVENVTGAAGTIATGRVVRAAPDGYTIILGQTSTHVFNGAIYPLPYDVFRDFAPIALAATTPQLIVSKNEIPADNLEHLIAWLKANPNRATMATIGPGSPAHIAGLLFQKITGTQLQFVPYRGGAPGMKDLLAGQIDLMMPQVSLALPQVQARKIRAYAVTATRRLNVAADIPTVDEAGARGLHVTIWQALWAPKGTPKDVIVRLNAAVAEVLGDPAIRQRLAAIGHEVPPAAELTSEALAAFQKTEIERWWPIIKDANIKAPQK